MAFGYEAMILTQELIDFAASHADPNTLVGRPQAERPPAQRRREQDVERYAQGSAGQHPKAEPDCSS